MSMLYSVVVLVVLVAAWVSPAAGQTTDAAMTTTVRPFLSDKQVHIRCTRDYMEAKIIKSEISNLDTSYLHLNDKSCRSTEITDEHVIFRTALEGCGTTHNVSDDGKYIVYYNSITGNMKSLTTESVITREHQAVMPFKCSYERKVVLSVVSFSPRAAKLYTKTASFGNFTFFMDLYKSSDYKQKHSYPAEIGVGSRMYLEVRVQSNDSKLAVAPLHCRATPTSGYEDMPRYVFINDSCATDSTVQLKHTETAAQRFSMGAFRFLPDYNDVYLHCEVVACRQGDKDSRCAAGCPRSGGGRRRRSAVVVDEFDYKLSLGPIRRASQTKQASAPAANPPSGNVGLVTIIAITAGVLALIAFVLVLVVVMVIRRRPMNGKHDLLVVADE
ncbi:ZP domain-containing protein [Nematostella vectensis]|uniref:ZP domain-containing protein n=1 Tax=Nematostella vectensis TaxID=45351 RepID=UPI0020778020|nr:ZP domain-containing protein [Nematostella vectensis]